MMSDETSGSREIPRTPAYRSVFASSVKTWFTSFTVVCRDVTNVRSAIDPTGIGARSAMPSNRPSYSGRARVVAFAAEHGLTGLGSSDAHLPGHIGQVTTAFGGRTADDLRRAIESGRVDELVSGFPTLTDRQQREFEALFGRADGLQVELVAERIKIDVGDRNAEVQMKGFFRYRQREGGANKLDDYRKKMYLAYGPTGWRVTSIR